MPLTEEQIQTKIDNIAGVANPTWPVLKPYLVEYAKPRAAVRLDIPVESVTNGDLLDEDLMGGRFCKKSTNILLSMVNELREIARQATDKSKLEAYNLDDYIVEDLGDDLWRITHV